MPVPLAPMELWWDEVHFLYPPPPVPADPSWAWEEAFMEVVDILSDFNETWWVTGGTLIGLLRYGHVVGTLPDNVDLVDDDIDVVVYAAEERVPELSTELSARLARSSPAWRGCFLDENRFLWCLRLADDRRLNLDVVFEPAAAPLQRCVFMP